MYILSFESSCDETAVAVVSATGNDLTFCADMIASQVDTHRLYGGVVPEIASRAHIEAISRLTYAALDCAGIRLSDVGLIAVTSHPGLIGALLVGVGFAKSLAAANGIPLVGVDHIKGHIAASYIRQGDAPVPTPPFLALVVSGGHTAVFHVRDYHDHRLLAGTRDDAMGEAFDKVGRLLGLPYPAGAAFDRLAAEGFSAVSDGNVRPDPDWRLPSPALTGSFDLSFSGPKTAAVNLMHKLEQRGEMVDRARFAAVFTKTAVSGVIRQLDGLMQQYPALPVVTAGGVAANSHLRRAIVSLCARRGVPLFLPPLSLCGDNGAMIAAAGYYAYLSGDRADSTLNASAADDPQPLPERKDK